MAAREAAELELRAALRALRELGADAEAERASGAARARSPAQAGGPDARASARCCCLLTEGLTNRQIAERLVVSEHTVHRHVTNILRKLELPVAHGRGRLRGARRPARATAGVARSGHPAARKMAGSGDVAARTGGLPSPRMWALGDYHRFAKELVWEIGPVLVEACGIGPGQRVLDVAAGTGNVAIRAAEAGAQVVASDITPENFAAGRREAAAHAGSSSNGSRPMPRRFRSATASSTP